MVLLLDVGEFAEVVGVTQGMRAPIIGEIGFPVIVDGRTFK